MIQKVGDILGKYSYKKGLTYIYIYSAKGSSHLSKSLIFVQVLIHVHACTFLEHSCIFGYLGPNRTEHVNQSHIFPILSLVLSDHQENGNQFKIIPLVVLRDAVVLSGEP